MKQCNDCLEQLPLSQFNKNKASKDGLQNKCRGCNIKRSREWRQANPEKARANSLRQTAKLRERNPHYYRDYFRKRYNEDEEFRASWLARVQERRAANKLNFTAEEFAELCLAYGGICLACKSSDRPLTVDHVVPVSQGGSNDISNIQPLCRQCNSRKGAKEIDYRPF